MPKPLTVWITINCGVSLRDTHICVGVRDRDFCVYAEGRKLIIPVDYWLQIQICACVSQTTIRREAWTFQQHWWEWWNGAAVLETSLAVPRNIKLGVTAWPSNSTLMGKPKHLCTHVHSSPISNSQKGEATQMTISKWLNRYTQWGPSHSGMWLSHEKEQSSDIGYSVDGPWTHNIQWKKQTQKDT